jgi:YjbE family integral membrane protein
MEMMSAAFWAALGSIILVNILLSGDNAIVIALAARSLPPHQQKQAIFWGSAAAIVMRIVLTLIAVEMIQWPYLKIVGGLLLLYIGVSLLLDGDDEHGDGKDAAPPGLWPAIRTILIADLVMSLDNVLAVAAAAKGHMGLLIVGLVISIPLIIFGSTMLLKVMQRFPIIIVLGAALLGYLAGEMVLTDPGTVQWLGPMSSTAVHIAGAVGAVLVVVVGKALAARQKAAKPTPAAVTAAVAAQPHGRLRRVLLAVDGSEPSLRAVQQVLAMREQLNDPAAMEVHLMNVQLPVPGDVSTFVAKGSLQDYYRENAEQALAAARQALSAAGQPFKEYQAVGAPGHEIATLAAAERCDVIVMGTRGHGQASTALLGSVAQGVLTECTTPLMLIK